MIAFEVGDNYRDTETKVDTLNITVNQICTNRALS